MNPQSKVWQKQHGVLQIDFHHEETHRTVRKTFHSICYKINSFFVVVAKGANGSYPFAGSHCFNLLCVCGFE